MPPVPFHKPFDRDLYNENNAIGNRIALDFLTQHGYSVVENGDVEHFSDRDCLVSKSQKNYAIEVERKRVWRNRLDWEGYNEVRVPYRKRASKADYYIMINDANTCLIMCKMADVKASKTTNVYTRLTNTEETFFLVPIEKFDVWYKSGNTWTKRTIRHNFVEA